jgi:hypothetical protein
LIECPDGLNWDEDKLLTLRHQYMDRICENYNYITIPWLMDDSAVIRTRQNITYGSNCKLDIVISEGSVKYSMEKPMKIYLERSVLSLLMLLVLTCAISPSIESLFKLNIHNQCLNVDLIFSTYIKANRAKCHRPPKYKVCAGDTMRSAFIIESDDVFVGGALIWKLQRRPADESIESGKDISSIVYLLVVWGTFRSNLESDALLVEHKKGFDWDEDNLLKFYSENSERFRWSRSSTTETWLLDDNTTLMTTLKIINDNRMFDITISEVERNNNARIPMRIDLER